MEKIGLEFHPEGCVVFPCYAVIVVGRGCGCDEEVAVVFGMLAVVVVLVVMRKWLWVVIMG